MSPCPSCGGEDHARASSAKCLKRKRRIRERGTDPSEGFEVFTVKRCLRSFLRPDLLVRTRERLLEEMRADARDLSRLEIELSLLVNYFYRVYAESYDDKTFAEEFPTPKILEFTYYLKHRSSGDGRQKCKVPDPLRALDQYERCKNTNNTDTSKHFDGRLRNFLVMNIAKRYETVLETNVTTHAFSRIKRFLNYAFSKTVIETNRSRRKLVKSQIHLQCFRRFYETNTKHEPEDKKARLDQKNNEINNDPVVQMFVDEWFDRTKITNSVIKKNYWRFVPEFLRMQKVMSDSHHTDSYRKNEQAQVNKVTAAVPEMASFAVFPQYTHGLKHHTYDTRCVHELLRRVDPDQVPASWPKIEDPRTLWSEYFRCEDHKNFGFSIQTDGVAVSLSMNRPSSRKKRSPPQQEPSLRHKEIVRAVAVDPGARSPLVTYGLEAGDKRKLSARRVIRDTGEKKRERVRKKITADVERRVREDREKLELASGYALSAKNCRYKEYTEFKWKWFESLQSLHEQKTRLVRLKFDAYTSKQKFTDRIVGEFFPDASRAVLYGAGCKFMNKATFSCTRKFSHDTFVRALKRRGRRVLLVDESYTTKTCSECFVEAVFAERKKVKADPQRQPKSPHELITGSTRTVVSKSPHRYVRCPTCRTGMHRDENGACNIFFKYFYSCWVDRRKISTTTIGLQQNSTRDEAVGRF